jgi:hypothetical protein
VITVIVECDHCGKRAEKKYSWIRDFYADEFRNFYAAQGFKDDFLKMDICPNCREKFEDITVRE